MSQLILQLILIPTLIIGIWPKAGRAEVHGSGNYSEKERAALKTFRSMIPDATLYQYYMKEDDFLIRWIRDQNFDLDAASQKLRTSLQWRKDNRINTIVEEDFSSILAVCPFAVDAVDREERPVIRLSLAQCDIRKASLQGNIPRLHRAIYWAVETCLVKLLEVRNRTGPSVRTIIGIADIGGLNLRQHACIRCLSLMLTLFETYDKHYPEYLEVFYFINVPRLGRSLIEFFLPLVSQRTRDIAEFYGHDRAEWQAEILKRISPDQLPLQYGGTKGTRKL